jgi:hypothetical protein
MRGFVIHLCVCFTVKHKSAIFSLFVCKSAISSPFTHTSAFASQNERLGDLSVVVIYRHTQISDFQPFCVQISRFQPFYTHISFFQPE